MAKQETRAKINDHKKLTNLIKQIIVGFTSDLANTFLFEEILHQGKTILQLNGTSGIYGIDDRDSQKYMVVV